ncbi:hypothetical protein CLIB1444_08S00562 [[Candida] jaroonii]|uniref:Uncharacterized protein n=1 Tax=[Candida] jaroonii TaxID=467808 RepID=A0ACA9YAH6_9ASCO|nr:hypothetical protein CLIB1444_08S00562 [[Candida] jaroonii]
MTSIKRSRKLPPEKRQKVSTACDGCKKRKFKCSGTNPCKVCVDKGVECSYSITDKRSLKGQRLAMERQKNLEFANTTTIPGGLTIEDDGILGGSSTISTPSNNLNDQDKTTQPPSPISTATGNVNITTEPYHKLNSNVRIDGSTKIEVPKIPDFTTLPSPSISPKTSVSNYNHKGLFQSSDKLVLNLSSNFNSIFNDFNQLDLNNDNFPPIAYDSNFILKDITLTNLPPKSSIEYLMSKSFKKFEYLEILHFKEISDIIHNIYDLHQQNNRDYILLYLVLSLSEEIPGVNAVAPTTGDFLKTEFFKSALYLLNNEYNLEPDIWLIQCHLLIYHFYREKNDLNKCYIHLGTSINFQKLCDKDKRFFKKLAIEDTLLSYLMGKVGHFNLNSFSTEDQELNGDSLLQLVTTLNQILIFFYNQNFLSLNIMKIRELSMNLKSWTINYPSNDFHLDLINLISIHLVSRPLYLFHILSITHPDIYNVPNLKNLCYNYFMCCVNSSIYGIILISNNQSLNDLELNLLHQNCQTIYTALLFFKKFNINYNFDLNYLHFVLQTGASLLPNKELYKKISPDPVQYTFKLNYMDLKNFLKNFINNDIAPTFKRSISYDSYDKNIVNKLS